VGIPVLITPAHRKKENVLITPARCGKILKRKMAMVTHAKKIEKKNGHGNSRPKIDKKNGHDNSRPSREGKRAGK
jgi:hypothetical protein